MPIKNINIHSGCEHPQKFRGKLILILAAFHLENVETKEQISSNFSRKFFEHLGFEIWMRSSLTVKQVSGEGHWKSSLTRRCTCADPAVCNGCELTFTCSLFTTVNVFNNRHKSIHTRYPALICVLSDQQRLMSYRNCKVHCDSRSSGLFSFHHCPWMKMRRARWGIVAIIQAEALYVQHLNP